MGSGGIEVPGVRVLSAGGGAEGVLRQLADCGSTGVLHLPGPVTGRVRLRAGQVVQVDTDAVPDLITRLGPSPERLDAGQRAAVARSAAIDAAVALLGQPSGAPPRFDAGPDVDADPLRLFDAGVGGRPLGADGPAAVPPVRLEVADLLAEVSIRADRLRGVRLHADDVLALRPRPGRGRVRIDPSAWSLLPALDRPRTPRLLAWTLALPLVETVLAAASLVDQGAADILTPEPQRRGSGAALPRRVGRRLAGSSPTLAETAAAVALAGPAAVPDREVLLRVLAGLRRL